MLTQAHVRASHISALRARGAPAQPSPAHKPPVITRHVTLCFLHVRAGGTCCIQDLGNICSFVILPRFHSRDAL